MKADPIDFMRRFFDAHVYLANWGEALFMVRLPLEAIDEQTIKAFCTSSHLTFKKVPDRWLLTWSLGETEDDDRFGFVEGSGWMARLAPVRDELLRGDLRSLYVGWLRAVTTREEDVDDLEPLALNGLQELTAAQQALAEFLDVDVDLLAGAGFDSKPIQPVEADETDLDAWLDQLPTSEIKKYLKQIVSGQGASAERELKRHYTAWQAKQTPVEQGERRTVATLRQLAEGAKERRLSKEAEARRQAEAERKKLRSMTLANLAKDFPRGMEGRPCRGPQGVRQRLRYGLPAVGGSA